MGRQDAGVPDEVAPVPSGRVTTIAVHRRSQRATGVPTDIATSERRLGRGSTRANRNARTAFGRAAVVALDRVMVERAVIRAVASGGMGSLGCTGPGAAAA